MRIVADNEQEYKAAARMQKVITGLWKEESDESTLKPVYKLFMNTPIEKSYVAPGQSAKAANEAAVLDTDDSSLFIPYLVQGAISRKQVAIQYVDGKGKESQRMIEPHSWRGDSIVSWCHEAGAWRQFKPKQILRVAVTSIDFTRDEVVEIKAEDAKTMMHLVRA